MLISGGEVDTERASVMVLDEFRGGQTGAHHPGISAAEVGASVVSRGPFSYDFLHDIVFTVCFVFRALPYDVLGWAVSFEKGRRVE